MLDLYNISKNIEVQKQQLLTAIVQAKQDGLAMKRLQRIYGKLYLT